MSLFLLPLLATSGVLLLASALGSAVAGALVPGRSVVCLERVGWGFAVGLSLIASALPLAFGIGVRPGWIGFLLLCAFVLWIAWRFRLPRSAPERSLSRGTSAQSFLVAGLLGCGVAVYALRALTEPMWSNDFLAIWGLKGKTIFGAGAVPGWLVRDVSLSFSHPEYPLGLPLLYAGIGFLLHRWDDHAMAILFPIFQVATILLLLAWLRRRGASRGLGLAAAALVAQFEPLYCAFQTGMAEVPYSFGILLLGTALVDAIDQTDAGAVRRLAFASFVVVSLKNEGLFLVLGAVLLLWVTTRRPRSFSLPAAALVLPAAILLGIERWWKGNLPLRDFQFRYLSPSRVGELLPRLGEAVRTAAAEVILPAWPVLLAVVLLVIAGRPTPHGDRLLALAALCAAAYLLLPSLAVLGPAWLVRTSFERTVSALAPLVAAALAARLITIFPSRDLDRQVSGA